MKNNFFKETFKTPLGNLNGLFLNSELIALCDNPIKENKIVSDLKNKLDCLVYKKDSSIISKLENELKDYFRGNLFHFTIPINPIGTDFQKRVFEKILKIEYGKTVYYKDLALSLNSMGFRAVGSAVKSNSIPIIIPCHRVIGKNNPYYFSLFDGEKSKKFLLDLEQKNKIKLTL